MLLNHLKIKKDINLDLKKQSSSLIPTEYSVQVSQIFLVLLNYMTK